MKTVSIGDTHGKAAAETILNIINEYDKFIFMGDYVDSPVIDNLSMRKNLSDIIELKKKYPEKIVLLWGNHDIHYLLGKGHFCSGFRPGMKQEFYEIFHSNADLFQLAFEAGGYLWTHAGISGWWYEYRFMPFAEKQKKQASVAELLNTAFDKRYKAIFDIGYSRKGDFETGGPLWCDIEELTDDP
jgi:predicted MPP superfamily phosphohydrolase